ncbi:MAG TPA: Gfo/Idh/MocA family oxidoreductase [Planctomycetota bacterium]|nr:Gfo/Idh/MocA family oxidoreductase [Planctomycetota bacterium]
MSRTRQVTRRRFLGRAAAAAAIAPVVMRSTAFGANDQFAMGFVGMGGQGRGDMGGFLGFKELRAVAVCDVHEAHREQAKSSVNSRYGNNDCKAVNDFREITEDPKIDAVFCATPDHWHAIITVSALKNGKDVYCEKPETLTVRQGRVMIETARRYGRVFSGGSQRVWQDYNWYHRVMWGGAAGKLQEVYVNIGGPSGDCYLPAQPVPAGLDWDRWIGPAPWRPYNKGLHPFTWRSYRDYSGGNMTDWGAHHMGGALFAAQLYDQPLPVEVIPPDGKEYKQLTYKYASGVQLHLGGAWDGPLGFKGTLGEVPERGKPRIPAPPTPIQGYRGRGGIFGDFVHCVRTRQRPFRDIEIAHRAVATCHLGNIAFWLRRPFKFDPEKEEIVGDPEANRWIDRPMRAPWTL